MCKADSFNSILLFFLAVNRCTDNTKTAYKQQNCPQKPLAVIARLRRFSRIRISAVFGLCCFYLKIRAALAVVIDNGEFMCTDRKRFD